MYLNRNETAKTIDCPQIFQSNFAQALKEEILFDTPK